MTKILELRLQQQSFLVNIQVNAWFPLGFTGLISSQSSGLSRVFNITIQKHQFFGIQPSLWSNSHIHEMDLCWQSDVSDFYTVFKFIKDFLPRSKHLLISWPQSTSTVILSPRKGNLPLLHFSPSICHEVMVLDAMILVFSMLSFKPAFSFSSFTLIKRLFSPIYFLPLEWYHLHIWYCWYFSWQSWFELVIIQPGISHYVLCI